MIKLILLCLIVLSNISFSDNVKAYYDNGVTRHQGTTINNKKEGNWSYYYENGKLKFKGAYINGKEDGEWVLYNNDGSIKEKILYDGQRIKLLKKF